MTKNDQELIAEAYQQIEEALWDRIKARGSQAVGAVRGAGDRIKGAAKGVAGKAMSGAAELGGKALGIDASEGELAKKGAAMQKDAAKDTTRGTYNRVGQANMGKKVGQGHMEGPMDPD